LRLCVLFQMTMPGAPCIYYGSEIGMTGATDPYNRAAFPWDQEQSWDHALLAFYRRAVALRREHRVLRTGTVHTLVAKNGVYGCLRQEGEERAVVLYNTRKSTTRLDLEQVGVPDGSIFRGVWNGSTHAVSNGTLP